MYYRTNVRLSSKKNFQDIDIQFQIQIRDETKLKTGKENYLYNGFISIMIITTSSFFPINTSNFMLWNKRNKRRTKQKHHFFPYIRQKINIGTKEQKIALHIYSKNYIVYNLYLKVYQFIVVFVPKINQSLYL